MIKVFIESSHAALEYDQVIMFAKWIGCGVAGSFDVGSTQRPKVEGITDISQNIPDGVRESDLFVLHQCDDYSNKFESYAKIRAANQPVVLNLFGQGCLDQHKHTAHIVNTYKNAFAVSYSHTDHNRLLDLGASHDKCRMIRFGKDMSEFSKFGGWSGRAPTCFMSCNSMHRRGPGCCVDQAKELMKSDVPIILGGKESLLMPYGIGELDYEQLRAFYRNARCFLTFGTQPAPMVLTMIEAMCTGAPVIVYNNGSGIVDEQLGVTVCDNIFSVYNRIQEYVTNFAKAKKDGDANRETAMREFNMDVVAERWKNLMEVML